MNALAALSDIDESEPVDTIADDGSPALAALKPPDEEYLAQLRRWVGSTNIALEEDDEVNSDVLAKLGALVVREYEIDENSRSEWLERSQEAMDLAMQIVKEKQYPWPKAANVIYPLMTTASIQFAARAYPAIVMGKDVVKGVVVGPDDGVPKPMSSAPQVQPSPQQGINQNGAPQQPPAAAGPDPSDPSQWVVGQDGVPQTPGYKQARADRVGEHMSFQLLDEQPEWEPETDTLLHILPIVGCAFRKTFFDSAEGRNSSLLVQAKNLVINYKARALETTPRATELIEYYPLEIKEKERADVFLEIEYPSSGNDGDEDAPIQFLEQHRWYDLDEDGFPEPYIVTVHKDSQKIVRIVARYELDGIKYNFSKGRILKIEPVHYYTKYDFLPNPEGGIYGVGFGQLLKSLNGSINTTLNMMLDAGHLQVVGGGFIGKGLSMNAGQIRFQPGQWNPVDAKGQAVRDALVPLPAPGPSPVLFQLLGLLIDAGKEVAGVKDVLSGETVSGNTPATTMLAMIEQGLKTFTAIYKRVHRSLKSELAKLYRLNGRYLDQETSYKVGSEWRKITRADYEAGSGVEPVSDPTMVTDMQRLGRAQFLMQFAGDPAMNGMKIKRRLLQAANIDNIAELFNPNPPPNPAILKAMLELQLKKQTVDMQQAEKEAGLQLRAKHDAALIESEQAKALLSRAQALNQIAQADGLVGEAQLGWSEHTLDIIKAAQDAEANGNVAGTAAANDPSQEINADGGDPGAQSSPSAPPVPPSPIFSSARVAPDGNSYVQHMGTGQYHRIDSVG